MQLSLMLGLDEVAPQLGLPGLQTSHLWTFFCGVTSRTESIRLLSIVHDMDHLKQKIREAVASVTPGMLAATWRELRSRLEFLRENNGDHVEVFFR